MVGPKLACCSSDGTLSIFQLIKERWESKTIHAHEQPVNSISWAPFHFISRPGESTESFCTGGSDKRIKIWHLDSETGTYECKETLVDVHEDAIRSVTWNPNSIFKANIIASCSEVSSALILGQARKDLLQ